jgi:uncharacterized membrane protein YeaQ/YmgE (transglycosylase-associated protein family)
MAFKFAVRGMLGGMIVPGVLGTVLILLTFDERNYFSVPGLVASVVLYSSAIGAIVGFIVGRLYANGRRVGFFKRLLINIGLSAFVSSLLLIAFGAKDADAWLRQAQIAGFLVLISGILPAITTGRLYAGHQQSEVL